MITSKARHNLQRLSGDFYARLQVIEPTVRSLLEYSQGGSHLTFTPHGLSHISAVEKNYDWLLTDDDWDKFNALELFCLICATFFHDALMIPRKLGDEVQARQDHARRAQDFLVTQRESIGLSMHEADAIAQVIQAHATDDFTGISERVVLGNEVVDLRKLGACLSLADICHADASRAPEIVLNHLELDESSRYHWRRHLQISGITRDKDTILMSALTFSDPGGTAVEDYKKAIEAQLTIVRPYFDTVLQPIRRVELIERRLESPLDQTLQFQTNTPAILKLLIEGVYDREDVFIRELAQNSFDACLVRRAKLLRRNESYEPQVLITLFYEDANWRAFRIDDNGVGMDVRDVQDTVLWIGSSIADDQDLRNVLQTVLGKNLIATFGIGLLSCFKISNSIKVRTCKENEAPLQFELTGVSDSIKPEKSQDNSIGSTIIVEWPANKIPKYDPTDSLGHYFRMIKQVELLTLTLEWSPELAATSRDELFRIALTEAELVIPYSYQAAANTFAELPIVGEDFSGAIWLPSLKTGELIDTEGKVDILNEGVFVTSESTPQWLPRHLAICNGVFNFSAGSISLPAGRDRVIRDEYCHRKQQEINDKSFNFIDILSRITSDNDRSKRDFAALVLTYMYQQADDASRTRILQHMDSYHTCSFKRNDRLPLKSLLAASPHVYLQYSRGRWVSELAIVDSKQLYHMEDDLVELQAALMVQDNEIVISAVRSNSEPDIVEASLIKAYFKAASCSLVDLTQENVIEGKQRSKPVPSSIRQEVGASTKFVEIAGLPNRKAWRVGEELWINVANPRMREVYHALQSDTLNPAQTRLVAILFGILSYRLDQVVDDIIRWVIYG